MKNIVVIYHGDCPDGFSAAWAAWKKFGDTAEYFPVEPSTLPPLGLKDKEIYMIDYTFPLEITKQLIADNKRVTSIDHHVSNENVVKITKDYSYAVNNSGAVLSWKYFHPEKSVPKLLQYIEDRDLWLFKLDKSREVCAYLDVFDFDFETWSKLADDLEDSKFWEESVRLGEVISKYEHKLIGRIIKRNKTLVKFENYEIYTVNSSQIFASEMGVELFKLKPPMALIWSQDNNSINFSLRSDGGVDVSEIAKKYGGGGHKSSAGFSMPINSKLPWEVVQENEK